MTAVCKQHNVPELLRGSGPCDIRTEVKMRNGKPLWWCRTHGQAAGAPDGAALAACPGAWFEAVPDDQTLILDLEDGQVSVWGAVPPAISIGAFPHEDGGVHVHRRLKNITSKDIDESYDVVELNYKGRRVTVEGMAARAYSLAELSGLKMTVLTCPNCGFQHIDEKMFATMGHRKHQCNGCGRNFYDRAPSIGNPLANAQMRLGLPAAPAPVPSGRAIELRRSGYTGIALWPSNAAIVSTMTRPEEVGIHLHAWKRGSLVVDETYDTVSLDGRLIDLDLLRLLAVQRALADGKPVADVPCGDCGRSLVSAREGWMEPTTAHRCTVCGATTRTRRKMFLNPLANIPQ